MEIKYKVWDSISEVMSPFARISNISVELFNDLEHYTLLLFTGFEDRKGHEIYDGDIIADWVETDEGLIQSKNQVFWNQPTGSWHLDHSPEQDKSYSTELWLELNDYDYEIVGNIYEI